MSWKVPGQNWTAEIAGKKVTFKPMTDIERKQFSDKVIALAENATEIELRNLMTPFIVKVEGVEGDIDDFLKYQSAEIKMRLQRAILSGNCLNEEEVKN